MNSRELAVQAFNFTLTERERFDALDNRANRATVGVLHAAADLAEREPDVFFGLAPSERERFLATRLVDLVDDVGRSDQINIPVEVDRPIRTGPDTESGTGEDITGSAGPAILRALIFLAPFALDLFLGGGAKGSDQPGSGQSVDRQLDDGFGFIAEEKQYLLQLIEMVNKKLGRDTGSDGDG